MSIRGRNRSGQTLFLTSSVFRASLAVEGCQWQRVSIAFSPSKGDGCMIMRFSIFGWLQILRFGTPELRTRA